MPESFFNKVSGRGSSNINEVIKTVLNSFFSFNFFLQKDFARTKKHQKAPKSTKSTKSAKAQPNKSTKRK